jgi:hypothetical protein
MIISTITGSWGMGIYIVRILSEKEFDGGKI